VSGTVVLLCATAACGQVADHADEEAGATAERANTDRASTNQTSTDRVTETEASPVGGDPVAVLSGIARQETFTELAAALQDGTVVEHPDGRDRVGFETPDGLGATVMVVRWGDRGWMVESFSHRVPCP
jgi:hypothetical protein